jgi:hypothetical protein
MILRYSGKVSMAEAQSRANIPSNANAAALVAILKFCLRSPIGHPDHPELLLQPSTRGGGDAEGSLTMDVFEAR